MHRLVRLGLVLIAVSLFLGAVLVVSIQRNPDEVAAASGTSPDGHGTTVDVSTTTTVAPTSTSLIPMTAPAPTIPPPPRSFTIAATGDFLSHEQVWERAAQLGGGDGFDYAPLLARIAPLISAADLAICHLETPLSRDDRGLSGYPVFNVPHELATAIAGAGYDTCSTSSNHALDQGPTGVVATLDVLDANGLRHTGTARSDVEAATPVIYDVQGVRVGHLSYTYGFNGFRLPQDQPWLANLIDGPRIEADAAAARAAGAEFVIVSLHWGNERQISPTAQQRFLGPALLASPDIDLILGHHAHVVQPIEKIGEEYVVYGLGNFLSNMYEPATVSDGVIVHLDVSESTPGRFTVTAVTYTPTFVERPSFDVVPVNPLYNAESYRRTVSAITSLGPWAFDGTPTG